MKKNNYTKKIRLLLFTLALFLSSQSIYAQSSSFVLSIPGMNLSFLNANRTLIYNAGNNGLAAGSKWRYDNLLSTNGITIYGVITIQEINNASIDVLDDETYGLPGRFQPRITSNTGGGYVLFQLEFFEVVTNNRVYISNYYFTAVDIDGGEYVELGGYSSYQVDATCGLTITNNATTGRTRFGGISSDLSNITFENTASFVASYVFPYTKVTFALGKSSAGTSRQYSTQFGTAGGTFNNPVTTKNPLKLIYISKTCDADKFVAGSTHKYSVTLENSGSVADSVKISDPLPTGLTYVPHSTSIYIPAANATETVADNFNTQSYVQNSGTVQWSSDWVEGGADATTSPTAGTIQITTGGVLQFSSTTSAPLTNGTFIDRNIDLKRAQSATLTFDYPAIALSTGALSVQLSSDGNIYTTVGTLTGTTAGSFSYTIPSTYFTKNTHLRFVNATGSSWASGRNISIDNVKITYGFSKAAETKTNALSGGTLSNGVPPNLLTNADQITLLPGVKATLTFDVTVNCDASGTITNTATATCPNLYDNSISASHIATVDPTNVTGASRCGNGSVTLSAAGASGNQTYRWYNTPSGGSILGTGSTFTTPNISSSTDYYVSFYNPDTGCETGRTKVTATISAGISGTGTISSTTGQNGAALNSGTISPTTASNNTTSGTVAWSNLTNITADDGSMVSATMAASALSNNLDITGFNFSSVPAGSQIVGISVTVNRNAGTASTVLDNTIQLLKSGTAVGDNKATTTTWPTTSGGANATYGSATDAWGVTWTGADLSNIGLRIQAKRNTTTGNVAANIDYVSITVYYSTFGDDQSSVNFAVSGITGATGYNWTVPTGATITSGQGTDNILVNFNNAGQSGTYSVCATPQDACGSGSQICQTIYISNNTNNEISGTVYNDPDGSVAPNKVDGTPVSSIGGQQLYAILTTNSDSKAISSITVAPDGTYKFSYLTSTTSNYYRIYINTRPFGDAVVASAGLPSGAVFNGAIDNDATNSLTGGSSTNGYITVTAGNNTNNTNVNFGIKINNPVANNDASTINEDAVATINILTNDVPVSPATINASTVDLDPATSGIQTALNTDNGSWSVSSGIVTFTPNPNYFGKDSINYTITDSNGYLSNLAKIVVTVNPVNDQPSFTKGADQTVDENSGPITVNGWATNISKGPSNESLQTLTFITTNNNNSLFAVQPYIDSNGNLIYTPATNAYGVATVTVKLKDSGGTDNGGIDESATQTFTIKINSTNTPPRAINDVNTTYTGTPVNGNVLTNDSDPEGNTLTVTTQTNASTSGGGTVTVNADGTYTYTPKSGFTGEDTFTYQVCDNGTPSACSTATVTIDVMPQPTTSNDPPVAVNDNYQGTINKPVSGNILSNDFDPDGTTLTVSSAKADTNGDGLANESLTLGTSTPVYGKNASGTTVQAGTLTISSNGAMIFTPTTDFVGTVPFTYNASDGSLTDNADGTITIETNPSNTNTTFATDDAYNVKSGHTLAGVSVLTNDNDPQGNTQTVQSVLADTDGDGLFDDAVSLGSTTQVYGKDNSGNIVIIGTLKVAATGEVTLVPTPNFAGTTQFVYTVSDNGTPQATDKATAYISVGKNTNYWIGTTSTNWNTTTNWTENEVPFTGQNIEFATAANNNGNAAVKDLQVPGSATTPTEIGNLTNLSTKSTVIPAGNALIVDGTVTGSSTPSDAGKIVIQAANGTPNGTIIIDCASNSTGGVTNAVYGTVQMYAKGFKDSETTWTDNFTGSPTYGQTFTTSYHWQQFGVPVESVQAEPSFYGSYIRAYDEKYNGDNTTYYNKWHVLNNSSMLDAFKGYEITQDVQTVYQLQGKLQFCDKTIHLTREAPGVGTKDPGELESNWRYGLGQNVFGNSFTSSIAIDKMVFPTNVEKTVYLYNTGRFTDWGNAAETPNDGTALTAGQYTAIPQNASPAVYDQGIPSMNGFLLKFTDAETVYSTTGADVTLSYSNGGVKPNTKPQTVKGANEIQPASNSLSSLSVQLQSKSTVDRLWLLSESGTSRSYENGWDGRKYFGTPTAFIYTESSEGTPLQVSTSENIDGTVINFYDNGDQDYTLVLTKRNLENYSNLQLIDLKEKTFTPLTNDTTIYSFTSQSKDILERRFVITNVSGAKISSDAFKNLSGYLKDNDKLEIMNFTSREGMMYLYDTSGRVLKTARISVSENEIPVSLQPGVYIVRLEADGKRESIKIAVR